MTSLVERVNIIRSVYDGCFGCGRTNQLGLALDGFVVDGNTVTVGFTPRADHRGYHEILHGGIVAAALDEVMAWSAMLVEGVTVVTGTLDMRFGYPTPTEGVLKLTGVVDRRRGKRLYLQGEMWSGDQRTAAAEGMFIATGELPTTAESRT